MFSPNNFCRIQLASGKSNIYGQPVPGVWVREQCSIVRMPIANEKSSVRADSSASRGNAMELQVDAVILLTTRTRASIDDVVEFAGVKLRVVSKEPRIDAGGRLDHYEIKLTMWSAK